MKKIKQLSLLEYLKQAPPSFVFDNLVEKSDAGRKILSSDFLESLERSLQSEASLLKRFNGLSPDARKVCIAAYLSGPHGLRITGDERFLKELIHSFLIYVGMDEFGTTFLFGFKDVSPYVVELFASVIREQYVSQPSIKPVPFLRKRCISDTTLVLIQCQHCLLQKKRDGALLKSSYQAIEPTIHTVKEGGIVDTVKHALYCIIQLIVGYCKNNNLMLEREKDFITDDDSIQAWLSRDTASLYEDYLDFTFDTMQFCNRSFFERFLTAVGERWFSIQFFPDFCHPVLKNLFLYAHYLGVIEIVRFKGCLWVRKSGTLIEYNDNGTVPQVLLLPDFTAVVTQECMPLQVYYFSTIGTITRFDKVYRGILNRESINDSLALGIHPDTLLEHLSTWRAPENVKETVREWIREYGRVSIIHGAVLISGDAATTRQLNTLDILAGDIEALKADAVFRIRPGRERKVWDLLSSVGFDPRIPDKLCIGNSMADIFKEAPLREDIRLLFEIPGGSDKMQTTPATSKYGEELKELELSELRHVLDYAMLMGYSVHFEYSGHPSARKGMYIVRPINYVEEPELSVEGIIKRSGRQSIFYLRNIKRIGVLST